MAAVEQSYRQTARALGYDELDAQLWASTVMAQLQMREEIGDPEVKLRTANQAYNRGQSKSLRRLRANRPGERVPGVTVVVRVTRRRN